MIRDGILYAGALTLVGAFAAWVGGTAWAVPAWAVAAFVLYFFRDPERVSPAAEGLVSPADGRVVDLRQAQINGQPVWKLSVFLSIFDVHVNRAPIGGMIRSQSYSPGRFLIARLPAASVENEQNTFAIQAEHDTVIMKQIAGAVARRIVFYKKVGDRVTRGERVGLIKFGSRVDLFFPLEFHPRVAVGDRVKAGMSLVAQPGSVEAPPESVAAAKDREKAQEIARNL